MENNKNELLEEARKLAEKHDQLKRLIYQMLDDLDKIELEYLEKIKKIKEK